MFLAIDAKSPQRQQMTDDLTKIDRWNSEPLDVHVWSDHPEIKALCDDLYDQAGMSSLEPKGNRKAKRLEIKRNEQPRKNTKRKR